MLPPAAIPTDAHLDRERLHAVRARHRDEEAHLGFALGRGGVHELPHLDITKDCLGLRSRGA
jgi:hypothetical protein